MSNLTIFLGNLGVNIHVFRKRVEIKKNVQDNLNLKVNFEFKFPYA